MTQSSSSIDTVCNLLFTKREAEIEELRQVKYEDRFRAMTVPYVMAEFHYLLDA